MRRDYFIFGGVNSSEYGVFLTGAETVGAPERDITTIEVPGRNGDLYIDNGRYKNAGMVYSCAIAHRFDARIAELRNAILAKSGYRRLEDTLHPHEFRLAALKGTIDPDPIPFNRAGEFTLEFDCKPQRFLKSGEAPIKLAGTDAKMVNPGMPALPLITLEGSGSGKLIINGVTVQLNESFSGLTLDCDTQNAYSGTINKNSDITAPDGFPVLPPGKFEVVFSGGVTTVTIIPRWWIL